MRLIAGETSEKAYLPRLRAIRALEKGQPLSDAERATLASHKDISEIDAPRAASRALTVAKDASKTDGVRLTALQAAADFGHAGAAPLARAWLAEGKSANLRAVVIAGLGIGNAACLGKDSTPAAFILRKQTARRAGTNERVAQSMGARAPPPLRTE